MKTNKYFRMKQYLIHFFGYNDWANRRLLETIRQIPDKEEAIQLFSHLITSQDKWLNRITKQTNDHEHNWFGPIFPIDSLEQKWVDSYQKWTDLLETNKELSLETEIVFNRASDGKEMKVKF